MTQIDDVDSTILRFLLRDSRSKMSELSRKTGLSLPAVKYRIQKLREAGILIGSCLNLNLAVLGYKYPALIRLSTLDSRMEEVIKYVKKVAVVAGIDKTLGRYNLCLFVFAKDIKGLNDLKIQLKKMDMVIEVDTNIWMKYQLAYDNIDIQDKQ